MKKLNVNILLLNMKERSKTNVKISEKIKVNISLN